jgi:hypothetical protein
MQKTKKKLGTLLTRNEMKQITGGNAKVVKCSATANCPNGGTVKCDGVLGDATNGGCDSIQGSQISAVSCRQEDGTYVTKSCTMGGN